MVLSPGDIVSPHARPRRRRRSRLFLRSARASVVPSPLGVKRNQMTECFTWKYTNSPFRKSCPRCALARCGVLDRVREKKKTRNRSSVFHLMVAFRLRGVPNLKFGRALVEHYPTFGPGEGSEVRGVRVFHMSSWANPKHSGSQQQLPLRRYREGGEQPAGMYAPGRGGCPA